MGIIVDLVIIVVIILSTYLGYRKGLIGVAFKILSFIIAIIITFILFRPVSSYIINNTTFDETIENVIIEKFAGTNITPEGTIKQEESNIPNVIVNYINNMAQDTINNSKEMVVKTIAKNLAINIINIAVILGLFILTRILLIFAKVLFVAISEIPIIKQFNEIGGILYGILRGVLVIYIILALISLILPMMNKTEILNAINNSSIGSIMYNKNIILMMLF